jgi:hypothetical protein
MELQTTSIKFADKLRVFVLCPGLSKDEIVTSFDKKEGELEIMGISQNKELGDVIDLNISGKIPVSPKYRSEDVKLTIENGIATLEFGLAKDVKLIKVE